MTYRYDPFQRPRPKVVRTRIYADENRLVLDGCASCGEIPQTPTGRQYLYHYRIEHDAAGQFPHLWLYCSKACMRAFDVTG